MKVLQTLPQNDLNEIPAAAQAAEDAGFDMVCTMENRHDPFLSLGVAAVTTEKIMLGTAIAIAFPRSPMVVANACWDLQVASKGRFVLGLGPQIRPHNEKRFSVPWSPPVPPSAPASGALPFHSLSVAAAKTPAEWGDGDAVPGSPKCRGGDGRGMQL